MGNNNDLIRVAEILGGQGSISLFCHESPDGDTLGSALALYAALKQNGRQAQVICSDTVPVNYRFLPGARDILKPENAAKTDVAVAIDCADVERMEQGQIIFATAKTTVCIDHHLSNRGYAQINIIDPKSAATGELVFELIKLMGITPDQNMATCLYTAILTDTGSFTYRNTTRRTMEIGGELLDCAINAAEISRSVYKTVSIQKTRFTGYVMSNIELFSGGRIGVSCVSLEDMREIGVTDEDSEGIIDYIRDVNTVEIAVFIRETAQGKYKVSMRSKDYADVCAIANKYGGGGHIRAAGCTLTGLAEEIKSQIIKDASSALKH